MSNTHLAQFLTNVRDNEEPLDPALVTRAMAILTQLRETNPITSVAADIVFFEWPTKRVSASISMDAPGDFGCVVCRFAPAGTRKTTTTFPREDDFVAEIMSALNT